MKKILLWCIAVLLALPLCGVAYQYIGARRDAPLRALGQAPGTMIRVGAGLMHIDCTGPAGGRTPTVILESGNAGWSTHWSLVQQDLSKTLRVCSYDRRGYAWSERVDGQGSAEAAARDLHGLLEAAGEHAPFVLVSHSLGYVYVRRYAYQYPSEVAGLVIADGGPPGRYANEPPHVSQSFQQAEGVMRLMPALTSLGVVRATDLLARPLRHLPPASYRVVEAFDADKGTVRTTVAEYLRMDALLGEAEALKSVGATPVTVVSAGNSYPDTPDISAAMLAYNSHLAQSLSTRGRHVVIPGTAHVDLLTDPRAAAVLAGEVRRVVATAQPLPRALPVRFGSQIKAEHRSSI